MLTSSGQLLLPGWKGPKTMQSTFPTARIINNGQINLADHDMGAGPPILLVHGFPELA